MIHPVSRIMIPGQNGYDISALSNVQSEHREILLCLHGFTGNKHSLVITALRKRLDQDGIGVVTFDWPAHGDSPSQDSDLTVENCLRDLDTVLAFIRSRWSVPISCFATSYGGYLAVLYRNEHPDAFDKLLLRSPALRMPQTFIGFFSEGSRKRFMSGEPFSIGTDRKMKLTVSFYDSLIAHDAFSAPVPSPERVMILQGDRDDVVSPKDTAVFAEKNHIPVAWFRGADHIYKNPADQKRIVDETRAFLLRGQWH